ncbi:tRNA pseudouridine 55 synthetase [Serratia symbiotica str. 'Cinara cedri']|nr:tRNA pseudouridine 55 synthetase [Serratia symbiotica str. 'Cinara cedri']
MEQEQRGLMSYLHHHGRSIHGILLLNKPRGLSSNDAVQKVKRLYNAKRAGHTGTLDPLASGMLPICLGEATKLSQFILNSDKHYRVIAKLGQSTNTLDADGTITQQRPIIFAREQLDTALSNFRGKIQQIPPMYSALKYQGKKLYEYARQGIKIPRQERSVTIHQLQCIRWQGDELELKIHCSKGTYIRALVNDLGEWLNCGAHVTHLHRLQVGSYPTKCMVTLEKLYSLLKEAPKTIFSELLDPLLIPMDNPVKHYPEVNLLPIIAHHLKQGQYVQVTDAPTTGIVRITEGKNHKFIGIGSITNDGHVAPKRLIFEHVD